MTSCLPGTPPVSEAVHSKSKRWETPHCQESPIPSLPPQTSAQRPSFLPKLQGSKDLSEDHLEHSRWERPHSTSSSLAFIPPTLLPCPPWLDEVYKHVGAPFIHCTASTAPNWNSQHLWLYLSQEGWPAGTVVSWQPLTGSLQKQEGLRTDSKSRGR